jgi:uncharacterized protein YdeI (YjbR/CyaY-like superfamily)
MDVVHFKSAAEFRRWLQKNHDREKEVWVGFYRKESGRGGITYKEALDQALCFGWIDGIRKKVDEESYTNRFTPRSAKSVWSLINIKRVGELTKLGLMAAPGLAAFKSRDPKRSGIYSFENRPKTLTRELERALRANKAAYDFFCAQPPGYRRLATWFVMSAKKDETRRVRLDRLIDDCAHGRRLGIMTASPKKAR